MRAAFSSRKVKDKNVSINCRVVIGNDRSSLFSTKLIVPQKNWDGKNQQVKGRDYKHENNTLNLINLEIKDLINQYRAEHGKLPTSNEVKDLFLKINNQTSTYTNVSSALEKFIQIKKKEVKPQSMRSIITRLNYFKTFIKNQNYEGTRLDALNRYFIEEYIDFLNDYRKDNGEPLNKNTLRRAVTDIFQFSYVMAKKGFIKYDVFGVCEAPKGEPSKFTYLNDSEIRTIEHYEFSSKTLSKYRDYLMFMYETGFHYKEMQNFDTRIHTYISESGMKMISIEREKSQRQTCILPFSKEAENILLKYGEHHMPKVSLNCINRYFKEIAKVIGIEKDFTSKIGRKSFATKWLNLGVSKEAVAKMCGHKDSRVTEEHYMRVQDTKIIREVTEAMKVGQL